MVTIMNGETRIKPRITATYDYTDEAGILLYQAVRYNPKDFRQRRPDGQGGWIWNLTGVSLVLYRLPELLNAPKDRTVYIVEGEKDADALWGIGLPATTNAMGAGKWLASYREAFRGRHVVIFPDNDDQGRQHAQTVAQSLARIAASVRIVPLPELPPKGDVSDWLAVPGNDKDKLLRIIEEVIRWDTEDGSRRLSSPNSAKRDKKDSNTTLKILRIPEKYQPFPTHCLPADAALYVREGAKALGCDEAFVALPVLSVLGSCIGNTVVIKLKGSWREPAVIWTAVVGESGTIKSPALEMAIEPLQALQSELMYHRDLQEEAAQDGVDVQGDGKAKLPPCPQYLVDDVTVEKVVTLLKENPRGLLLCQDELSRWLGSFLRYKGKSNASDLGFWLSTHRAGPYQYDRKTGDHRRIYVPRVFVGVCGCIQPGVLARALTREYDEAGLTARLLPSMPPRVPKVWSDAVPNEKTQQGYGTLVEALLGLKLHTDPSKPEARPRPYYVELDPEAHALWVAFFNEWGQLQCSSEGYEASCFAKIEGYVPRFALVHHVCTHLENYKTSRVTAASTKAAITLGRWFAREAMRVYAVLKESEDEKALRRLVEFIQLKGGSLKVRDLQRTSKTRYPTAEMAEAELQDLVEKGIAHWEYIPPGPEGGTPTRTCVLNPLAEQEENL